MKIYKSDEIKERENIIERITFDINKSAPEEFEDDDFYEAGFWITFYDETGCVSDEGSIGYYFQNEFPESMNEPASGFFYYEGELSMGEMGKLLKNIGFKEDY